MKQCLTNLYTKYIYKGILSDWQIEQYAKKGMITPFVNKKINYEGTSYGLSSAGYDIRLGDQFINYENSEKIFGTNYLLEPRGNVLASSLEKIKIPNNVIAFLYPKSTLARLFISQQPIPIETGWEGYLTLEITNLSTTKSMHLISGMGIAQIVFYKILKPNKTYDNGKYQYQCSEPTEAILKNK